jgi:diguanylate cyclase (GGDEF)-like protein
MTILIVEDSRILGQVMARRIAERTGARVVVTASLAEARAAAAVADPPFDLALAGLVLPDCREGGAVDYLKHRGIPCIVFTGEFSEDLRQQLLSHNVIDYVIKENPASLDHLVSLVERLNANRAIKVLVVDDSASARQYIARLLAAYQFQVEVAGDGQDALEVLDAHPEIRLVVTDHHMPRMSGIEMIRRIRLTRDQDQLAIIGVASPDSTGLSARFIKLGANDFIHKPFLREEFFCRVVQNIRTLELVARLREAATTDFLSGLHNRRYFFEAGAHLFASMRRQQISLTLGMLDVDFFKKVNDTYGHEAGDDVIRAIGRVLSAQCRGTDIVARFGGEEFAILGVNMAVSATGAFFERIRAAIAGAVIETGGHRVPITASIGVCRTPGESLSAMVETADRMLYRAKDGGRNRVEFDS